MDFPGEPWVRTREGRVALPKGGEGDMLHSQLVKLGQLQGRKEVRANHSKWIISEELITTIQSLTITNITDGLGLKRLNLSSGSMPASRGNRYEIHSHISLATELQLLNQLRLEIFAVISIKACPYCFFRVSGVERDRRYRNLIFVAE